VWRNSAEHNRQRGYDMDAVPPLTSSNQRVSS
jgi:hypothetical protein